LHVWIVIMQRNEFTVFRFLWPCIVSKLWSERKPTHYPTKKTLQLISTFSPLLQRSTPRAGTRLVLLKTGIMMTETCWESIDNKHQTVASCWFSLSLDSEFTMFLSCHNNCCSWIALVYCSLMVRPDGFSEKPESCITTIYFITCHLK